MPAAVPSSADDDLPVIQLAQSGDLDAFDLIVAKYQPLMSGLLHRFSAQRADLEDLVQETFVRAWRGLPMWRPERPFVHWLKRIAVRVGLEFCRRRQRSPLAHAIEPEADRDHPLDLIAADQPSHQCQAKGGDALEQAQFLLAQLPPDDRALLTLLHLDQMPVAEIAGHLGCSRANVKIKAYRARHRLRQLLNRHGYTYESFA